MEYVEQPDGSVSRARSAVGPATGDLVTDEQIIAAVRKELGNWNDPAISVKLDIDADECEITWWHGDHFGSCYIDGEHPDGTPNISILVEG